MTDNIQSKTSPTSAKERVVFLDVLRGFALMGILFANLLSQCGFVKADK